MSHPEIDASRRREERARREKLPWLERNAAEIMLMLFWFAVLFLIISVVIGRQQ